MTMRGLLSGLLAMMAVAAVSCSGDKPAVAVGTGSTAGFSLTGGVIKAARISAPAEQPYIIKDVEHFETGSEFEFTLVTGNSGAVPANLRHELWDLDGADDKLCWGAGALKFQYKFDGDPAKPDCGDCYVWFYVDVNTNGELDWIWDGEPYVQSAAFFVMNRTKFTFNTELSSKLRYVKNQDIADIYKDAETLVLRKDSEEDYRACVEFTWTFAPPFTVGPNRPDPVEGGDYKDHFTGACNVVWVENIDAYTDSTGKVHDPAGRTAPDKVHIVMDWQSRADDGSAFGHEVGHTRNLVHADGQDVLPWVRVMYEYLCKDMNKLTKEEAMKYDGGK